MSHNQFEIPQELRQLAEENVERARQLYLQFMAGVEQTMSAWSAPSSDLMAPGFNQVRERATKLTKENADAAFKLAKEVANAKDLQELLSLQSRYVQSQMQWYADQTQEFGKLMAKALTSVQQQPRPREATARATSAAQKPSPKLGTEREDH